jgi:hypothetical protein
MLVTRIVLPLFSPGRSLFQARSAAGEWSQLLLYKSQIPSTKQQISSKYQTASNQQSFLWILNFGHWDFFVIWDLIFEISVSRVLLIMKNQVHKVIQGDVSEAYFIPLYHLFKGTDTPVNDKPCFQVQGNLIP